MYMLLQRISFLCGVFWCFPHSYAFIFFYIVDAIVLIDVKDDVVVLVRQGDFISSLFSSKLKYLCFTISSLCDYLLLPLGVSFEISLFLLVAQSVIFYIIQVSFIGMASLEEIIGRGKVGTLDMLKVCTWILGSHFSVAVYCRHLLVGTGLIIHSLFCFCTCLCLFLLLRQSSLGVCPHRVFCIFVG